MSTTITPGPWRVEAQRMTPEALREARVCNPWAGQRHVVGVHGEIVATVHDGPPGDAALLAAAPELLNMLQRVVDECRMVDMDERSVCPVTMEHAMQALAKAGGAPVIETADDAPAWAAERRIQCHADAEGRWFAVPEGKAWGIQGPEGGGPEAALRRFRELNPDYDPPEHPEQAPDPVVTLRRVLRWYRETTDGDMPPELHDDACRAVGEEVGG